MQDKAKKILLEIFGQKELGFIINYGDDEDPFVRGTTEFIPLKILKTDFRFHKEISEVPLENSKVINDNIIVKPAEGTVQIMISDQKGTLGIGRLYDGSPEVIDTLKLLDLLRTKSYFFDIITLTRKYTNMQLIDYAVAETPQNQAKHFIIDLQCKGLLTFDVNIAGKDQKKIKGDEIKFVSASFNFKKMVKNFVRI
jgi:hypothetical protein